MANILNLLTKAGELLAQSRKEIDDLPPIQSRLAELVTKQRELEIEFESQSLQLLLQLFKAYLLFHPTNGEIIISTNHFRYGRAHSLIDEKERHIKILRDEQGTMTSIGFDQDRANIKMSEPKTFCCFYSETPPDIWFIRYRFVCEVLLEVIEIRIESYKPVHKQLKEFHSLRKRVRKLFEDFSVPANA